MTNTIEELASEYVKDVYGGDTDFIDEAENVLSWLFNKSLASRLTAEEKREVKGYYSEAQGWLDEEISFENPNSHLRICAVAIQDRLERIFGADFFKYKITTDK